MAVLLQKIIALLCDIRLGGEASPQELAALDFGVLKIAVMMAALDGEILPGEHEAFEVVHRTCRGYGSCSTDLMFAELLREEGRFLDKTSDGGVLTAEERLSTFREESGKALPRGFKAGSMADLRRAFALWQVMAMSDGSVSDLEQAAMKQLLVDFASVPVAAGRNGTDITALLERDFLDKVESAVRGLADPATCAEKQDELVELVTTITLQDGNKRRQHRACRVLVTTIMQIALAMSALEGRVA